VTIHEYPANQSKLVRVEYDKYKGCYQKALKSTSVELQTAVSVSVMHDAVSPTSLWRTKPQSHVSLA